MTDQPAVALPPLEPAPRKKRRGCLWTILIIFALLVLLLVAGLLTVRAVFKRAIRDYTENEPAKLPRVELTEGEASDLGERVREFFEGVRAGQPSQPMRITAADLNRAIAMTGTNHLRDRLYVTIEDNCVKGQISMPLDMTGIQDLRGRYLNGVVTLKVDFNDGELRIWADSFEAHGKPAPNWVMKQLRERNFAEGLLNNQDTYASIASLQTIVITNQEILLIPKPER